LDRRPGSRERPALPWADRLEDRLLLVTGPLPQHAVEAKADEQRDKRKDDDDGQILKLSTNPKLP
jgi:hypothetical protein